MFSECTVIVDGCLDISRCVSGVSFGIIQVVLAYISFCINNVSFFVTFAGCKCLYLLFASDPIVILRVK